MLPSQAEKHGKRSAREVARDIFRRARAEHSSPRGIGLSVAAGMFAGCTPWGFHSGAALGLATVLRLNRLWAFLASRISIVPIYVWIAFCEIEIGHRLRTGHWADLAPRDALTRGRELLTDALIGIVPVGAVLSAVLGLVAYAIARRWQKAPGGATVDAGQVAAANGLVGTGQGPGVARDVEDLPEPVSSRRLDGPRRPSSESPQ